ncbi:hypothetical protein LJC58_06605, partial [Lachnospiraceae bacterium OttesenSCG-928-D06]|nr:hypothetical protein [Lachnospiraceae bacterium OttesenSCG-928-D06]
SYAELIEAEGATEEEQAIIDETNAKAEELNLELEKKAWAEWQANVDACERASESGNHFHSIEEGEAEAWMREDRDQAWESFINLEYTYAVTEVGARNGYPTHDYHPEDKPLPIISVVSSQAGGNGREIGSMYKGEPSVIYMATSSNGTYRTLEDEGWDGTYLDSEVSPIPQHGYEKNRVGYTYQVINHRTEGELHFNKRDLELYQADAESSYGKSQGDATLEGAVYGLYAAEDIFHPDNRTGKVFSEGDLVAIAATDKNGDGSFISITEESATSRAAQNLYNGQSLNGVTYPDYAAINGNQWIGRPLFMGAYYIEEISRSEGYELSKYGVQLKESNRSGDATVIAKSGSATAGALYHPINEWDGSWNEFQVRYYGTINGFSVDISGYPEGSRFYEVNRQVEDATYEVITNRTEQPVMNEDGEIVYKTAQGGEYKLDADGNKIPLMEDGEPVYNLEMPIKERITVTTRLPYYPNGETVTENEDRYEEPEIDPDFIIEETNDLLGQIGYRTPKEGAPAFIFHVSGETNGEMIEALLEKTKQDTFWDSYYLEELYEDPDAGEWMAVLKYDYTLIDKENFYDENTERVILKRYCEYNQDGLIYDGHCFIVLNVSNYSKSGNMVTIDRFSMEELVLFGQPPTVTIEYAPLYETYSVGEILMDNEGNPIPEMETVYEYGIETVEEIREVLTEITNVSYNPTTGIYTLTWANVTDWQEITETLTKTIRAAAPAAEFEGMAYADYIIQKCNPVLRAYSIKNPVESGSYVRYAELLYPGQYKCFQDAGTREAPIIVLQRIIKQRLRIDKTISLDSYDLVNSYSIHKDPFTILFGGYNGRTPAKSLPGFNFKVYLVSDLVRYGQLHLEADGSYDYGTYFSDQANEEYFNTLALELDTKENDRDGDLTTIHVNKKDGELYFEYSGLAAYGIYVVVEQQPTELTNKHYQIDNPREILVPFVPEILEDGTVLSNTPASEYYYNELLSPEELVDRYHIRFNEETHIITANNRDGSFPVYKYGLCAADKPAIYENPAVAAYYKWDSTSESAGIAYNVYYDRYIDLSTGVPEEYGIWKEQVSTMKGKTLAIDHKYAQALVPWSVLPTVIGGIINDDGDFGNRQTGLDKDGEYNFIGESRVDFINDFYNSYLRVEKIDSETGENLIHEGALFKIFAAKRDVEGEGINGVSGTGNVLFDEDGIPVYDENEQIFMYDSTGNEVGVFKAYSTIREVVTPNGIEKLPVGYLETFQPLGAGVYVLVEVSAPSGYVKSPPVAFEVYSDEVTYYHNGNPDDRRIAVQYQYIIPFSENEKTVSQIYVEDRPSHVSIFKVEDGIDKVTYMVRGSKALLQQRGDVENLQYDPVAKEWYGFVTKAYDEWSENLVYGTEEQLKKMENVKLLYDLSGRFLGKGIRFDISVTQATLSLYKGLQVKQLPDGSYSGVSVEVKGGKVVRITASETGSYTDITTTEKDKTPAKNNIYDIEEIRNLPVDILFFDLSSADTEKSKTGELYILDERGNRTCLADPQTGMAYVKDDYGNLIVYPVDENGNKILSQSIRVNKDEAGNDYIYTEVVPVPDENDLPLYYESGRVTLDKDEWQTNGNKHPIARLPFGAYILEETKTPYDQGYIRTKHIGFILQETDEEQKVFLEDDFTKVNIGKVDIRTKQEIPDAHMTLYDAVRVKDDSVRGWHLEIKTDESGNKQIRSSWISGYQYDDNGNSLLEDGKMISTSRTHWIDHIPIGDYILKETIVPEHYGYVQSESIEVIIEETGDVQTFVMEDDYTVVEIIKKDINKDIVLPDAQLGLYYAKLDRDGKPIVDESGNPVADFEAENGGLILSWKTEDGKAVASTAYPVKDPDTGEQVFDKNGEPLIGYDYKYQRIETTLQGRYCVTETGATRMEYLPPGYYVLLEENAPVGFATAAPLLIEVEAIGGTTKVQEYQMDDYPLTVDISKVHLTGEKEVAGATMCIYEALPDGTADRIQAVDEDGTPLFERTDNGELILDENGQPIPVMIYNPAKLKYEWVSGKDGEYVIGDELPEGASMGDLKSHIIKYIPLGKYVLVEAQTPYGFLTAVEIPFEVMDTKEVQKHEMIDEIPDGYIKLTKTDEETGERLGNATFVIRNLTLGIEVDRITTDVDGKTKSVKLPIGCLGLKGKFKSYTYEIEEVNAPEDYMLNPLKHEFQFAYIDGETPVLTYEYNAENKQNQVKISKQTLTGKEELPGASLKVIRKDTKEVIDEWISTEQIHYITGLKAGTYVLIEVATPGAGYSLAEEIEFEIKDNMTEVPLVTMYDEHTTTQIDKVASNTGKQLAGAKLQITDAAGQIVETFVTDDRPHMIYGLAPGVYILKELEAPAGYHIAQPITFTVTDEKEVKIVKMVDRLKTSGGGKNIVKDRKAYISKEDVSSAEKLAGAWIVIYNPDGSVYAKGQTDDRGLFQFERPTTAGRYKFHEVHAPKGYFLNETIFYFHVDNSGNITGDLTIKDVKKPNVIITKRDITDAKEIPGAEIVIMNAEGQTVFKGVSNGEGKVYFEPLQPGVYMFWETVAPEGYKINETVFKFEVHEDGSVTGDHTIFDELIEPDEPGEDESSGDVPKTGDQKQVLMIGCFILLILSAVCIIIIRRRGKKD